MTSPRPTSNLFERTPTDPDGPGRSSGDTGLPKRERSVAGRLVPSTDLSAHIHPDELPAVTWLLDFARQRPDFTAALSLLARDTDRWETHRFEIAHEVMGPILRLAGARAEPSTPADEPAPERLDRHGAIDLVREAMDANHGRRLGIALLDIDRMKAHSELLGEDRGDDLVELIGRRIAECEGGSLIRRLESDEFLIVTVGLDHDQIHSFAERARIAVNEPIRFGEMAARPTCTIGVAHVDPGDWRELDATLVYRRAETALVSGKERGRNQVAFYTPGLEVKAHRLLTTTARVVDALERRSIRLNYQPIVSLADGEVTGLEGLLRTDGCSEDDPLAPWMLVEAADEVGVIASLNRLMLERLAEDLESWQPWSITAGDFHVSLNVSAAQLSDRCFVPGLVEVARRAGASRWLCVELAGSATIPGRSPAFEALRRSGIPLGLDGLGSSGSTLSDLCRLPISFVKIGPDLTRWVDLDSRVRTIVGATISAAHGLGASAVAVGVERESQRDELLRLRCDAAQGHLFHRPLDATGVTELLGR